MLSFKKRFQKCFILWRKLKTLDWIALEMLNLNFLVCCSFSASTPSSSIVSLLLSTFLHFPFLLSSLVRTLSFALKTQCNHISLQYFKENNYLLKKSLICLIRFFFVHIENRPQMSPSKSSPKMCVS